MRILKALADNRSERSLANWLRRRRMVFLLRMLEDLPHPVSILDVGGTEHFWQAMGLTAPQLLNVTVLNIDLPTVSLPNFTAVQGDARDLREFADRQFDLVFSNSVIEHVGSGEDQRRMANEVRRVGKRWFIQTPARSFPLEPHFLFPFFGILPLWCRLCLIRNFNLGWYSKIPDAAKAREFLRGFQLLSLTEFRDLFPNSKVLKERVAGITKSFIALGPIRDG